MSTQSTITIAQEIALAVKARQCFNTVLYGHRITIWFDTGIPVLTITHPEQGVVFEEAASDKPEVNQAILVSFLTEQQTPTAQEVWAHRESSTLNRHTNEYIARSGEWRMAAPKKEGEPDWANAQVTHLRTWSKF